MNATMPTDRLFLRETQVSDLNETIRVNESKLANPHIQDKPFVRRQTQRLRKQLETQRAPELDSVARDVVAKRAKELERTIPVGMPSHEEMRKNPNGAVGAHQRWEKTQKKRVIEWKNAIVALNPGNTDPELSSVERLRPTTSHLGMHSAQIPGKSFSLPSDQFKENYDEVFGTSNPSSMKGKPRGSKMSAEARKAAGDRARARWAEKKAAEAAAKTELERVDSETSVAS
jgi:hypothetical protein